MATVFVTGGTGFIGRRFVRRALDAGHRVQVLARSQASWDEARAMGAEPVAGDLATEGPWQSVMAGARWVAHLAQPETFGGRVTRARAERYRRARLRMDRLVLDPLRPDVVERVLYVGGTSYYGHVGRTPVTEDVTPRPRGWGPYVRPAIEALDRDRARGLPIVEAFPGYVYGDGSWFREYILAPLRRGKALTAIGGGARVMSPVHVDDCARALAHLAARGDAGRRYFVVDDRPSPSDALGRLAAAALGVEHRVRVVPAWACRLLLGPVVTDSLLTDCALSNERLRATGFACEFPTIDEGVPAVVRGARR